MTASSTLDSEAVSVSVGPLEGGKRIELSEVVVVDEIPLKPNIIPDPRDLQKHDYLRGVDLPDVEGATVTLLIGANFPEARWNCAQWKRWLPGCSAHPSGLVVVGTSI